MAFDSYSQFVRQHSAVNFQVAVSLCVISPADVRVTSELVLVAAKGTAGSCPRPLFANLKQFRCNFRSTDKRILTTGDVEIFLACLFAHRKCIR